MRRNTKTAYEKIELCKICVRGLLKIVSNFQALPRVTSDCKAWPSGGLLSMCVACGAIQKVQDMNWLAEVKRIYNDFQIYHQAQGQEQYIFDLIGSAGAPRSYRLIQFIRQNLHLGEIGDVLDVGCGNGAALSAFGSEFPKWSLHGTEWDARSLERLRSIPNFKSLHVGPITDLGCQPNLISMIHALEHMTSPIQLLTELKDKLAPNGYVFIQVPDAMATAYDLIIADHAFHFTSKSLGRLTRAAGFRTVFESNSVLPKELTWVGQPDSNIVNEDFELTQDQVTAEFARLENGVNWLSAQIQYFDTRALKAERFGIFGSSISATWLNSALHRKADFFVDEDPGRAGQYHMGVPILQPHQVAKNVPVFLPMIANSAESIAARLGADGTAYIKPPSPDEHRVLEFNNGH